METRRDASQGFRLSAEVMGGLVDGYFQEMEGPAWNRFASFDWEQLRPERLSEDQRSVVQFITFIEDHLPGYFLEYQRLFPLDDGTRPEDFVHNREVYRFYVKWAQEEDAHAHALFLYQVRAGLADAQTLRGKLADEGRKPFHLDMAQPIQVFAYTLIQEKATQLFYQQFARSVQEPVLRAILLQLVRDEARHFAFFSRTVETYLRHAGADGLPPIQEVLERFKMPLSSTLRGYWRWSLRIADAVGGYDHSEAYESLIRTINRCAEAPTWSKAHDLAELVRAIRATA
jgi:rubrerythrin